MEGRSVGSSPAPPPPLHPAIAPLSYLLGRWRGQGEGGFPTINSFAYGEELLFSHSGKVASLISLCVLLFLDLISLEQPVIAYSQKTWKLASGEPMHAESGYWRPKPDGSIEVVIAQSTGLVEVQVLNLVFLIGISRLCVCIVILQKGTYDAENKIVTLQSELVGNASKVFCDICYFGPLTSILDAIMVKKTFVMQVKEITRVFEVVNGELSYVVQMATVITNLQPHLKALLKKV
ncbi:hypothetical protein BHE74_00020265 [Ensete ventricosum]|nr:hypothetical protein GW17_00039754 [Ensete ventricosum]RWW71960.1 hypothetical protein BHE74_00020265 [Ensete ventricosum]